MTRFESAPANPIRDMIKDSLDPRVFKDFYPIDNGFLIRVDGKDYRVTVEENK